MGILYLSPKYEGEAGELVLQDRATIRAYLEELRLSGAPVQFQVPGQAPVPAAVVDLADQPPRFVARLARALPPAGSPGEELDLRFTLDRMRFLAAVRRTGEAEGLTACFTLPATVRHADRRDRMRVRLGSREKATVTALEGLLGARGITGALLDLSMEGLLMRVDRATPARGQVAAEARAADFPPGTRFPILRIDQLPFSPVVVCSGVVAHATDAPGGPRVGIQFEALGEMEGQLIGQVLGRRLPKFNRGFPERRPLRDPALTPTARVAVVHHGGAALEVEEADAPPETGKAVKRVLLVLRDDLERTRLVSALRADGFRKVHEARSFPEAVNHVKVFPMDVVILEELVGEQTALDFLTRIRLQSRFGPVPVVLLAKRLDVRTRTQAKAAKIDQVVRQGTAYGSELKDVLEGLLGL